MRYGIFFVYDLHDSIRDYKDNFSAITNDFQIKFLKYEIVSSTH